ncbi:gamma-glutamyl hydrolase-like [Littorina saxatilis]|uniref:folate gamma-glutamyl hydrolase n=1 Tax=Littorina saxatilis TaxID=31220 RepID=A0AAN9GNY2_9CAEN
MMLAQCFLLLLCLPSFATALLPPPFVNYRPIIGVLAQQSETPDLPGDTYINAEYIKFLEFAGARVVPILVSKPASYYKAIFSKINGVLFPGGSVDETRSPYALAGRILYDLAIQAIDNGDYFPLWGTCLGFQFLACATANTNFLNHTDSYNMTLPLQLSQDYKNSRMFGTAPESVMMYLMNEAVTENFHHDSVLLNRFLNDPKLTSFYRLLSYNGDRRGVHFVSTFEAFDYPIYGSQWHPEVVLFGWATDHDITHSLHAIAVSQYIANFFVTEARRNKHRFTDPEDEANSMIEKHRLFYLNDGTYVQRYYFNSTHN